MPSLYVANVTNQVQLISFRLDYDREGNPEKDSRFQPAKQQIVDPGRQVILGGRNLHATQVASLIRQLEKYGLTKFDDLDKVGRDQKVPYLYREDLAVPPESMRRIDFHNRMVKTADGKHRREQAAIATNETVQKAVENSLLEQGITDHVPPESTSVAFETVDAPSDVESDSIAEGFDIVKEGQVGPHSKKPAAPVKGRRGRPRNS